MTEFFEEVEEQLRSDRYRTILAKGWPYVAALAVAALLVTFGVWGWQTYKASQAAHASETYTQALDALGKGDTAGADKAFAEVAKSGPPAYKSLALQQQAGIRLTNKQPTEAIDLLERAAKVAPNPVLGDIATLKAAYLVMDRAPYAEVEARLKPLMEAKRPYRSLAKEALAMAKIGAGKIDEAKADFAALQLALDAPEAVRQRAQAVQILIAAGTAKTIPTVAKAAAELPPLPPAPTLPPGAVIVPQPGQPQSATPSGAPQ